MFDDFEGTQKGVVNVSFLRQSMPRHILIEPCPMAVLERYGFGGRIISALPFNMENLSITNR